MYASVPLPGPNVMAAAGPMFPINIVHRNPFTGEIIQKRVSLSVAQLPMLEVILRTSFLIPSSLGVMITLNDNTIVFPVSNLNLFEASRAYKCELQTFAMPVSNDVNTNGTINQAMMPAPMYGAQGMVPAQTWPPAQVVGGNISSVDNNLEKLSSNNLSNYNNYHEITTSTKNKSSKAKPATNNNQSRNSAKVSADEDEDEDDKALPNVNSVSTVNSDKDDKRRYNRGLDHRKSYLKEEKLLVMLAKDCGRSAEEIASRTGLSKSNVEKWCGDKTRQQLLSKYSESQPHSPVTIALDSTGLHFAVGFREANKAIERDRMQTLTAYLFDRLRSLSTDSGLSSTALASLLPQNTLPSLQNPSQLSGIPPSIATTSTISTQETKSLTQDNWDFDDLSSGPMFKKYRDMDSKDESDLLGTPISFTSGSIPFLVSDSDVHSVASILAFGLQQSDDNNDDAGRNNNNDNNNNKKLMPNEDIMNELEEDEILKDLELRLQSKRVNRLVTNDTFAEIAQRQRERDQRKGNVIHDDRVSNVTMQYNDCATWNMDTLIKAAEYIDKMDSPPCPVMAEISSKVHSIVQSKQLALIESGAASSASDNSKPRDIFKEATPELTEALEAVCDKMCAPAVSLSVQAQRPLLLNTKYLQNRREEHALEAALEAADNNMDNNDSDEDKIAHDTFDRQQKKEDAEVLKMLGE